MPREMPFIAQTGSKEDGSAARKVIRRHVMLGKNEGRAPRNPKRPAIQGAGVFRKDEVLPKTPTPASSILRPIASALSFLTLSDTVTQPLLGETLQFCSSTHEHMYALAPCIAFDLESATAVCTHGITQDSLYLNVLVFGAQAYMNLMFQRTTSQPRWGDSKATLQHHARSLQILRARVAAAEGGRSRVTDITIMSVCQLVFHALPTGDVDSARVHMLGLRRLVSTRQDGIYSFREQPKATIELLR